MTENGRAANPHETQDMDELLEDANRLIESVHNLFPESAPATHRERRTMPSGFPPPSPSVFDVHFEVARINRFCDSVDESLRDFQTPMTNNAPTATSQTTPDTAEASSPRTPESGSAERRTNRRVGANRSASPIVVPAADEFQAPPQPTTRRSTVAGVGDDDDDVVIVSSTLNEVVDLCTPARQPTAISRLVQRDATIDLSAETPVSRARPPVRSPVRPPTAGNRTAVVRSNSTNASVPATTPRGTHRHRTSPYKHRKTQPNSHNTKPNDNAPAQSDISGTTEGRPPYMCPVCMECSVNNVPTTTKCGHVFCASCIKEVVRITHKCPICNTKLTARHLFRIYV